jgi:hypothetical protein
VPYTSAEKISELDFVENPVLSRMFEQLKKEKSKRIGGGYMTDDYTKLRSHLMDTLHDPTTERDILKQLEYEVNHTDTFRYPQWLRDTPEY